MNLKTLQLAFDYDDLSKAFGMPVPVLKGALYGGRGGPFYWSFEIPKRSGGARLIESPNRTVRKIQRALVPVFDEVYRPTANAHGFIRGRSVATNVTQHIGKQTIVSIDLLDFFHSITFSRVRGLLLARPFSFDWTVANVVAQACCYNGRLPAGGITSPVIANLMLSKLDRKLAGFAARLGGYYSRYADDLTFSFNRPLRHIPSIAVVDGAGNVALSAQLLTMLSEEGFSPNPEKTRIAEKHQRKLVTGVVVNEKRNVRRRWLKELDATLHAMGKFGVRSAAERLIPDIEVGIAERILLRNVHGRISYLRMIRGPGDWVAADLAHKFNRLSGDGRLKVPDLEIVSRLERASRALVIVTVGDDPSPAADEWLDQGTGFLVGGGLIVTAEHVLTSSHVFVRKERSIGSTHPCDIVHRDAHRDIAILRLKTHDADLIRSRLSLASEPSPGSYVYSFGYPAYGMGNHSSQQRHQVTALRVVAGVRKFNVTGTVTGGLSGGPVLDDRAKVVGIVHRGATGVGFGNEVIAASEIRNVIAASLGGAGLVL